MIYNSMKVVTNSTQTKRESLFTKTYQTFPTNKNGFKAGMRLEGVDPLHPSMFCVLSVAEILGYRIRVHFDGYSDCYDFWVNADSFGIRPVGWCEKTGHKLHGPKGYKENEFEWSSYLQACNSPAAPKNLFKNHINSILSSDIQVGMKLEAVDRKNPSLICVASVADIVDDYLLVHFDNWDDTYDYWCDLSSPHIHPVGWCQKNGRPLTAPQGHPRPERFLWEEYLQETNTAAVPGSKKRHGFTSKLKLEAVDKRNPMLIRVATIVDVDDYRLKIHFDGWSSKYDYWIDSDTPDIHPAGWCQRTGHPLEPPLHLKSHANQVMCPTPGCKGVGHIKGSRFTGHHSAFGCPYSEINMKKEATLQDRFGGEKQITLVPVHFVSKTKRQFNRCDSWNWNRHLVQQAKILVVNSVRIYSMQQALHQSVFLSAMSTHPGRDLPLCWEQHCKLLPGVAGVEASRVAQWTVDEVASFVHSLPGCEDQAKLFKEEQIDGKAFLLLTQADIVKIMSVKLGPALKIYNSILMFKNAEDVLKREAQPGNEEPGM
uniref:L3MBTL histone methyl-lysine binding protein 4 n=1 Tax=Erpetoichthys calabaricus TaxID=27687 RepID=A0A8C4RZQ5_ERPCA